MKRTEISPLICLTMDSLHVLLNLMGFEELDLFRSFVKLAVEVFLYKISDKFFTNFQFFCLR